MDGCRGSESVRACSAPWPSNNGQGKARQWRTGLAASSCVCACASRRQWLPHVRTQQPSNPANHAEQTYPAMPARLHGAAAGEGCQDCPIADSIRSTYRHRPRHATRRNATQRTRPRPLFLPRPWFKSRLTRLDLPRDRERGQHSNQIPCFTVISLRFFQIPCPHAV
jgi:hypothetical protein